MVIPRSGEGRSYSVSPCLLLREVRNRIGPAALLIMCCDAWPGKCAARGAEGVVYATSTSVPSPVASGSSKGTLDLRTMGSESGCIKFEARLTGALFSRDCSISQRQEALGDYGCASKCIRQSSYWELAAGPNLGRTSNDFGEVHQAGVCQCRCQLCMLREILPIPMAKQCLGRSMTVCETVRSCVVCR